jgi:hypothetical protein
MKTRVHRPAASRTGWLLLWVFGVPMPLVVLLLVLRDLVSPSRS